MDRAVPDQRSNLDPEREELYSTEEVVGAKNNKCSLISPRFFLFLFYLEMETWILCAKSVSTRF